MKAQALSVAIMAVGPALLIGLVYRREREVYGVHAARPEAEVLRAPCAGCGAALVAAELLYVAGGRLMCESCRQAAREPGRSLSDAELALLASRARATARRRPTAAGT